MQPTEQNVRPEQVITMLTARETGVTGEVSTFNRELDNIMSKTLI